MVVVQTFDAVKSVTDTQDIISNPSLRERKEVDLAGSDDEFQGVGWNCLFKLTPCNYMIRFIYGREAYFLVSNPER